MSAVVDELTEIVEEAIEVLREFRRLSLQSRWIPKEQMNDFMDELLLFAIARDMDE